MSETMDTSVPSSRQSKAQYQTRPSSLRKGHEAVFPILRLTDPFYGDTTCPHNVLCGLNKSTQANHTTAEHILKPAIWQSTYPSPVFDGVLAEPKMDLCLDLAKRKKLFTQNVHSIKQSYKRNKSKIDSELSQIPKDNVNTSMVKHFAEALEMDPDKYFNGTYDWYFTGGSMDIVDVDDQEFLIHSEGNNLQNLKISKLNSNCDINTTNIYDTKLHSLHKGNTIYEIKSVVNEPYFTVRQKHQLTVINLRSDTLKLLKIHSDIPLVTSAVDPSMKLIMVDAKQNIQLFSLIDMKPISTATVFTNQMTIDNWTTVRFVDANQFICASRKIISVFDIRQSIKPVIYRDMTSSMGPCDDFTCMEQSSNGYNLFVTTTHKLQAFDIRNAMSDIMPTLTWVHQLKTAPVMMDINKKDDAGELIVIAGIKSGDVKVFDTTHTEDAAISTHLPYTPLSVHDAYKYAKSVGKFLDPKSLVQHQLRQSNTGIKLRQINSNEFSLLIKNTCGDVFQQDIKSKVENEGYENLEPRIRKMVDWDEELRRRGERENKLDFHVTDVTNFQSMVAYLRSNMYKKIDKVKVQPNTQKQAWQMSIEELASYQDVLANSLLDKWVIPEDVEMDEKYTDDRMNDWVESTVEQYHIFEEDICVKGEPEIQEY